MTITLASGRTVKVHWVHSSHDFVTRKGSGSLRMALDADARQAGRRLSLCEISQVDLSPQQNSKFGYATLGQGVAITHPNDTFRKAVGRKYSLEKAMIAASLNRDEREQVWAAYKDQFGWNV